MGEERESKFVGWCYEMGLGGILRWWLKRCRLMSLSLRK